MGTIDHGALVKAMEEQRVTQAEIAASTGLSASYVCDIVNGRRSLKRNPKLRVAIAQAVGVPVSTIEVAA